MNRVTRILSIGTLCTFLLVPGTALAADLKYSVKKGDSLYLIGKKFEVSIDAIKKASNIKSENLSLGQVLYIPGKGEQVNSTETTNTHAATKYTVVKGDSLYLVGKKFKVSPEAIQRANNLKTINLSIGQVLYIPSSMAPAPATPSRSISDRVGMLLDWSAADKLFPIGDIVQVTDVETGKTFRVKRLYGSNHADVEPVTYQDTQIIKELWGGSWSWARRAIVVELKGRMIAASMNGMPHGNYDIKNNGMNGHVCMHFLNSRTHANNSIDPNHQDMVRKAAGMQ